MRKIIHVLLAVVFVGVVGCVQNAYSPTSISVTRDCYEADTSKAAYEDKEIKLTIAPVFVEVGFINAFNMSIENKTNNDISIDWKNVYFIENGRPNGGFMFEGVMYAKRNEPQQPFLVFAKSSNNIKIYPVNYVAFSSGIRGISARWHNLRMENGEFGVYASLKIGKMEKKIRVSMVISGNTCPGMKW
ncbi:MAG: hypothetical protein LBR94_08890 [Desulfovibrio sp.]|jgi:hypothetical protein|nr:hypothetical protein [Desulfovibrio sp.]